jgi:hypothetical protein
MTTFPLQSPHAIEPRPVVGQPFARLFAALTMYVEAFAEAQEMARVAERRYGFAE